MASVVRDSIGGALAVAEQIGGTAGEAITVAARSAFVDGMATASLIGAAVAVGGAVVAALWLPARGAGATGEERGAGVGLVVRVRSG